MFHRPSALKPLRHADFRRFWAASQMSNFGGLVQGVAAAWTMTSLTSSPGLIALVQASGTLPILIFALAAGALADSFDRRRVMLAALILMGVTSVCLVLAARTGVLNEWSLLAFTFVIGIGGAFYNPSWQASVGELVPRDEVPEAVSLNSMGFNLMRSIGPAAGGAIVAAFGAAAAFLVNAISYFPIIAAIWWWKPATPAQTLPREPLAMAVPAGLRYVLLSPNLMRVMLRSCLFGLGAVSVMALLPIVARDRMNGDAVTYGLMLGALGLGALGGGFANAAIRIRLGGEGVIRLGFACFALALVVLAVSSSLWTGLPAVALAGAAWVMTLSLFNVTVQLSSPRWVLGRTLAFYQMAAFGGMAAGSALWGLVAGAIGIPGALLLAALWLVAGAFVGLRLPLPSFADIDLSPLDRFRAPELQLDLRPRSGPILVMIDYHIDPADITVFLAAMTERRRIRRRDGARQWVLLRDLERPDMWTESYHVATWEDYLRHNMRRTVADAAVSDTLLRLHRGSSPPLVHRMIERQSAGSHADIALRHADPPH